MGWLDKLLGRDKEDAGEPAGTSTSVESDMDVPARPTMSTRTPGTITRPASTRTKAARGRGGLRAASSLPPAVAVRRCL